MSTAEQLRRRWFDADGLELAREARAWLTGRAPRPRGLHEVEGRTDLRGIPLTSVPTTVGDPHGPSVRTTWEALDLRGSSLHGLRFYGGRIADCRFEQASLSQAVVVGTEVVDCTFHRADLRTRALTPGPWHGLRTIWRRVTFDRANLRGTQVTASVFDRCSFENTSNQLFLVDCEFHDCLVRGTCQTLVIDGRGHRYPVDPAAFSMDFSDTVLTEFHIEGYRLNHLRLPDQDDLVLVKHYPSVLRAAAGWLRRPEATEAEQRVARMYDHTLKAPGAEDSDYCVALNGYGNPETASIIRAALRQAQPGPP